MDREASRDETDMPDDAHGVEGAYSRKIIHVDMDAFYASVEQRDDPQLRGKPVAVGSPERRGVVAAASYEARQFGVRSAMPSVTAARRCPDLIFVKPRFDVYRAVSEQIHAIFAQYTPLIEPLSLDEAYLDVTENLKGMELASDVAKHIRAEIFETTGLTASAGISYNKFLAKMASAQRKPNGQFAIPPGKGEQFVGTLPIEKFHGVGPATARRMKELGVSNGAELKSKSLDALQLHFGKSGSYFYWVARGIDNRAVNNERVRKSVGAENTFRADLTELDEAIRELEPLITKVCAYCGSRGIIGRTVTLKVKYADFDQITRSRSLPVPTGDRDEIARIAQALLAGVFPTARPIRLLGVTLASLQPRGATDDAQTSFL